MGGDTDPPGVPADSLTDTHGLLCLCPTLYILSRIGGHRFSERPRRMRRHLVLRAWPNNQHAAPVLVTRHMPSSKISQSAKAYRRRRRRPGPQQEFALSLIIG